MVSILPSCRKVKVTTVEIWEYEHIEERLIPFLRGEAIDFGILGKPDLVVSRISCCCNLETSV